LPKYIKWISRGVFLGVFAYVNVGHLKVNKELNTFLFHKFLVGWLNQGTKWTGHIAHGGKLVYYKACPSESGTDKFMQRFI
jgi:hypothetical protein